MLAGHLKQVAAHRRDAMETGHPLVRVQAAEQVKAGLGAVHHGGGHGEVEPYHR